MSRASARRLANLLGQVGVLEPARQHHAADTERRHRQRGLPCVAIRRRDSRLEQADHAGQQPLVGAPHYRLARAPSRTRFMLASRRCGVPGTPVARPGASLARR